MFRRNANFSNTTKIGFLAILYNYIQYVYNTAMESK